MTPARTKPPASKQERDAGDAPAQIKTKRGTGARGPRIEPTIRQRVRSEREALWRLRRKSVGYYNEPLDGGSPYVIYNRKFIKSILLLSAFRKDVRGRLFAYSLINDGFLNGTKSAVAKLMAFEADEAAPFSVELVELEIREAATAGKTIRRREAAEIVCARHGLPGNSFTAAVRSLESLCRKYEKHGRPPMNWHSGLTGASWLVWPINEGDFDLPLGGQVVPDDEHWRALIFTSQVNCRFLPVNSDENHPEKNSELQTAEQAQSEK